MCALTLSNCAQQPSNESPDNPLKQVNQIVDHTKQDSVPETEPDTLSQRFTISGNNLPIKDVLTLMARESHLNIDIHPSINAKVTLSLQQETIKNILERICRQGNLIYRFDKNVLIIEPDLPYLKNYKIDYVNIERDTKGGISVTNQLASAQSGIKNVAASSGMQLNNSSTSVSSTSNHHFWASMIKNIEEMLEESDKQIVIRRLEFDSRLQADFDSELKQDKKSQVVESKSTDKLSEDAPKKNELNLALNDSDKKLKSYRTLFASKVIANKEAGIITIRATQQQHQKIDEFIKLLLQSATRQVLIEASIIEITLNDEFQSGVDWSRLGRDGKSTGWTFQQSTLATNLASAPVTTLGYHHSNQLGDIAATIKFLQTFGKTKVLSSP